MTFAQPWLLCLLIFPALLAAYELRRRGAIISLPFDHGQQSSGLWWARGLRLASLLPPALLAVAIVLLARPVRREPPRQERMLTNIEFVVDVSGSMTSSFGESTRFDEIAVGMALAGHPPHRSVREELPHTAPALCRT